MLFKTLHLRLRLRLRRNYCDLRCPPLRKTIGGDAHVAHSQIIGGDAVKLLNPHRVSAPLHFSINNMQQ